MTARLPLRLDGVLLAALGALAVISGLVGLPTPVATAAGIPVVLLGPGYGLQRLLVPPSRSIGWPERLVLAIVGSLAVAVGLALVLQATPGGIATAPVSLLLGGACLILGALVAARAGRVDEGAGRTSRAAVLVPLAVAAAIGVGAAAYGLERAYAPSDRADAGLDASLLAGRRTADGLVVDVVSAERGPTRFVLRVLAEGAAPAEVPIELAPGARWSGTLTAPAGPVEVQLVRADAPGAAYRRIAFA